MWQHLQHCSPDGLFAKLQLLCLQTVCFMHNNAVYGYNGTKVIVELLQLISYSSRKRKYLYFAHWSAQRPKRVFGNVPRSLSLSYALFPQHSRAAKIKITTKAHTQRELQRKWWLLSARTESERWEGALVLFVHELAKYLKDLKENSMWRLCGSFSFHLPRRTDVSGSFVAVVRKLARANASSKEAQNKTTTATTQIKEKQNEYEKAKTPCIVLYCGRVQPFSRVRVLCD